MDGGVCRPAALGSALVGGEAGQEDEQERQASEDQHHPEEHAKDRAATTPQRQPADNAGRDSVAFIVESRVCGAGSNSRALDKSRYAVHNACKNKHNENSNDFI